MAYRWFSRFVVATLLGLPAAQGADWIVAPSYYTHDPMSGQRVSQYTPVGPFYSYARPDFVRSGFRHTRSSIQAGNSADHMHIVEEWGRPVRPYGEWRFPFRPYSVPYGLWGPPFAGLGMQGFGVWPPMGMPDNGMGEWNGPYDQQQPPPYYDGSYPMYRTRPQEPWPPLNPQWRGPHDRGRGPGQGGGSGGGRPSGGGNGRN